MGLSGKGFGALALVWIWQRPDVDRRRQIWQVQGAAIGGWVGFVLGQLSARMGRRSPNDDSEETSKRWL